MTSPSETTPSTFLSDRPISHAGEDRLNVAPFVHRLVGPILHAPEGGGFVLGIYGPWGSGKSSALTLLEAALEDVNELEGPDAAYFADSDHSFRPKSISRFASSRSPGSVDADQGMT